MNNDVTLSDLDIIEQALSLRVCFLETGVGHISANDAANMGEETAKKMGVRMPSADQMKEAVKTREVWEKVLRLKLAFRDTPAHNYIDETAKAPHEWRFVAHRRKE